VFRKKRGVIVTMFKDTDSYSNIGSNFTGAHSRLENEFCALHASVAQCSTEKERD